MSKSNTSNESISRARKHIPPDVFDLMDMILELQSRVNNMQQQIDSLNNAVNNTVIFNGKIGKLIE